MFLFVGCRASRGGGDTLPTLAAQASAMAPTEAPASATRALPATETARVTETAPVAPSTAAATASRAPATATPSPTATYATHVVQTEETLLGIAARYSVSVDEIVAANELADPNFLQLGQALNIPAAGAALTPIPFPERDYGYTIVGYSVQGRAIEAFSFGEGAQNVVLVGGIHGGYEWNTVLLAYQIIDFYNGNREEIPAAVTVHIIPAANPDGLYRVTGREGRFFADQVAAETTPGRFNANNVDLNRNWSCDWSAAATWGRTSVYPGSAPFSEPETRALRNYFTALAPRSVVFWHSATGLVSRGICGGEDAGGAQLAEIYGNAANYPVGAFTAYEVSGDASDWLASQGIPSFAVELFTHESTESGRNLAGVQALLEVYGTPVGDGEALE